jgi:hypothetical protein
MSRICYRPPLLIQHRRPAFVLLATPLLFLCVTGTSDYWLPEDFRQTLNALNDNYEKARREVESRSNDKTFSRDWQKAHNKYQQNEKTGSVSGAITPSEQNEPLFITVPIRTRLKSLPKYNASDPEWKEFIKLQEDDKRVEALFRTTSSNIVLAGTS